MNTKERKGKKEKRLKLLLELEDLVQADGDSKRIDEIRKELNSSPEPQVVQFDSEVTLPFTFDQYLKLRMLNLTDKNIIEVYDLKRGELIRFKRFHGLYVASDLKKKLNAMALAAGK